MSLELKLNIGAGETWSHAPEPWVDIDVRPSTEPDLVADVTEGLPYASGSVSMVYAGHFLEHLPPTRIGAALGEIMRLLQPGGQLMVVGPDIGKPTSRRADLGISADADRDDNPALHSWDCTAEKVTIMLEAYGFAEVFELPIEAVGLEWPVFDRVTADQFAVEGRKPWAT